MGREHWREDERMDVRRPHEWQGSLCRGGQATCGQIRQEKTKQSPCPFCEIRCSSTTADSAEGREEKWGLDSAYHLDNLQEMVELLLQVFTAGSCPASPQEHLRGGREVKWRPATFLTCSQLKIPPVGPLCASLLACTWPFSVQDTATSPESRRVVMQSTSLSSTPTTKYN